MTGSVALLLEAVTRQDVGWGVLAVIVFVGVSTLFVIVELTEIKKLLEKRQ